jgi:baculoviral IAP repeat-containing protein 6
MNKIKFLITGPKDTPYQDGCFVFEMVLPPTYPKVCPQVQIITTGRGSVRFNPNLYNCGKVCLSLLGTWSGRPEEAWNENSTMLQLFVSIQSLILIDHPYFNEPGYQSSYGTPHGMERSAKYNEDVQANNIKWAIIDAITNPDPCFADIIKTHFKLKKNDIIQMATEWGKKNSRVQSQLDTLKSVLSKL